MVGIIITQALDRNRFKKIFFILIILFFTLPPYFSALASPTITAKKATIHPKKQVSNSSQTKKKIKHFAVNKPKKKTVTRPQKKLGSKKSKKRHPKKQENKPPTHIPRTATIKTTSQNKAQINTTNITKIHLPWYLLSSIEKTLIGVVRKTIATVQYTAYKLGGTRIDTSRGIYIVDCSTYVDHVLKTVYPRAYTSLTSWSGSEKPTSNDYYYYFTYLTDNTQTHWNTIDDVLQLRPGDILVFRYKTKFGHSRGGHVMIVMDKPVRQMDTFLVRVADSASTGHSIDTRLPHASGIGIGTLLLKVDPKTYQPYAYAWKMGSRWDRNVTFAMARPMGVE